MVTVEQSSEYLHLSERQHTYLYKQSSGYTIHTTTDTPTSAPNITTISVRSSSTTYTICTYTTQSYQYANTRRLTSRSPSKDGRNILYKL